MPKCPKCGYTEVEVIGEALVTCDVEEHESPITGKVSNYWGRWEVIDTADLKEAHCLDCGYEGEPEEFELY